MTSNPNAGSQTTFLPLATEPLPTMGISHSADMNDICTTLDPKYEPKFHVAQVGAYSDDLKNRLRKNYPKITPFFFSDPPAATFAAIKKAIKSEARWTVKHENEDELLIELEASTALFKFTDDMVVQVKPYGDGGSIVNMRSRSRVGSGDWGANHKRMCYLVGKLGLNRVATPAGFEAKTWVAPVDEDPAPTQEKKTKKKKEKKAPTVEKKSSSSSGSASASASDSEQPPQRAEPLTED